MLVSQQKKIPFLISINDKKQIGQRQKCLNIKKPIMKKVFSFCKFLLYFVINSL